MLIDQYGREIKNNRPITDEIVTSSIRDRFESYPSHGLTPERLATILKEADQGDVYRQSELFEEMEEKDLALGGILQTRKLAVVGLEYEILPASNSSEDKKIAASAQEMFDYVEGWEDSLLDTLDAIGKGFSVQEIIWDVSEGQVWIKKLNWIHQKRFTFTGPPTQAGSMTINPLLQVPRLLTDEQQVYGEELVPNKFLYHRYKARSGTASRGGLLRPCTYMYLFKNFDIKAWLTFAELFSVPMRVGKYPAGASKEDKAALRQAVFNLAVDAAAVMSDSTIIEIIESKGRGETSAFKDLAEYCERGMSKAVLGHAGSSDSTPGRLGSEDQAKLVRQDLLEFDAKSTERLNSSRLLAPWAAYNFGPDKGVPKFKLHYKADEDLEKLARTYGVLVKDVNYKGIGVKHLRERFNLPEPEAGEETVQTAVSDQQSAISDKQEVGAPPASPDAKMKNKCTCGCGTTIMLNAESPDDEWISKYMDALGPSLDAAKAAALQEIEQWMNAQATPPSLEEFTLKVQEILGAAYIADAAIVAEAVAQTYSAFRLAGTGASMFGGPDLRAMNFLAKLDDFYLSKFIQNPEAVAAVNQFLSEQFLKNGPALFSRTAPEGIEAFRTLFDQQLGGLKDYQVRRIVDTAVQRTRNWAHIAQLDEAAISEIQIVEPTRDCDFCKEMHGKVIPVRTAYNRMQSLSAMSPEDYEAELKASQPTVSQMQAFLVRGDLPPYHPHCRGRIIKRLRVLG